ncbi:MAG: ABC transporter permease, partial [Pleomorphochaeta sp.]
GDPVVDSSTMFFDLDIIDYYLELEGSATSYAVSYSMNVAKIKDISNEETANLNKIVSSIDLEAYSWDQIAEELLKFQSADTGFGYLMLVFTFVIAVVGISNTMLMSISERKNEIAMLKTLGYKTSYINQLFTVEGAIIGFIGTCIGAIIALLVSLYYQKNGIDFSIFMEDSSSIGYRISGIVHAYIYYSDLILIIIASVFVSMGSAFFAVKKIAKSEIIQLFNQI